MELLNPVVSVTNKIENGLVKLNIKMASIRMMGTDRVKHTNGIKKVLNLRLLQDRRIEEIWQRNCY